MRRLALAALVLAGALSTAQPAAAGPVYLALGDALTFGETDLVYRSSNGDRGYVRGYADYLARVRGVRPKVINLAVEGETTSTFLLGTGNPLGPLPRRFMPIGGWPFTSIVRMNPNYSTFSETVSQRAVMLSTIASEQAAGNTIETISISLGWNDVWGPLYGLTVVDALSQIDATLAAYRDNYAAILGTIRQMLPNADLFLLNYYNPYPATQLPSYVVKADAFLPKLNAVIRGLATQYGAAYVDTFTPFVGREAELTFADEVLPGQGVSQFPFSGPATIGNFNPTNEGYAVIGRQLQAAVVPGPVAVPEPSSLILLGTGLAFVVRKRLARRSGESRH